MIKNSRDFSIDGTESSCSYEFAEELHRTLSRQEQILTFGKTAISGVWFLYAKVLIAENMARGIRR